MTDIVHEHAGRTLTHVLVEPAGAARATIVMFPTVMGVTALEQGFAERLAGRGDRVLVADLFGRRFVPAEREQAMAAMAELRSDRTALRDQLLAVLDQAHALRGADAARMAAMGFCFGGQCALDLARTGTQLALAASFHGLFDPPGLPPQPIRAAVIAFHGWADRLVPPEEVTALGEELTAAGAQWQLHAYGGVGHAFTNPNAPPGPGFGYDNAAASRSFASFDLMLDETFGPA
jgi:dienelactone hydrolase